MLWPTITYLMYLVEIQHLSIQTIYKNNNVLINLSISKTQLNKQSHNTIKGIDDPSKLYISSTFLFVVLMYIGYIENSGSYFFTSTMYQISNISRNFDSKIESVLKNERKNVVDN